MGFNSIRQYIHEVRYILDKDIYKLMWLLPLFLFSSVLDLLGISMIASFASVLVGHSNGSGGLFNTMVGQINFLEGSNASALFACSLILCAFLGKAVTAILINKKILQICFNQTVKLRTHLMAAYQAMSFVDYMGRNGSEYIYNIQTIVGQFAVGITQSILRILSEGIICIVIITFLAFADWQSLVLLLLLLSGVLVLYDRLFKKRIKTYGKITNEFSTRMVQTIREGMNGFRENRIYGNADYFNERLHTNASALAENRLKSQVITTSSRYVIEFVLVLFLTCLIAFFVLSQRSMATLIPTIATFALAAMRLMPSANQILSCATKIRFGRNTVEILYSDLKHIAQTQPPQRPLSEEERLSPFQTMALKEISFTYPGAPTPAVSHVNLTLRQGESIGFIGSSGAGKTTLVDIILGLLPPDKGEILYNGHPISPRSASRNFAYLPQDIYIIDDTIKGNIALGVPDHEVDMEKLDQAIESAQLKPLVDSLPQGKMSIVGDRGMKLSGGQRQRIAIARAFYHDRKIMVMDESTSALDDKTEQDIVDAIFHLKHRITLIIIAHRITTLMHCDAIYEMNQGRIQRKIDYKTLIDMKTSTHHKRLQ